MVNVKIYNAKSIDDYLNRFIQLKARCFTQIPEHELVRIATIGPEFLIRKEIVNQQLKDLVQLGEKVWRTEQLKFEKERNKKFEKFPKKDKLSFVDVNYNNPAEECDTNPNYDVLFEESEINLAELRLGPPHVSQLLKLG